VFSVCLQFIAFLAAFAFNPFIEDTPINGLNSLWLGVMVFHEVRIYEAKINKQEEIEQLMGEVAAFYREQPSVISVACIKRNHIQKVFNAAKAGELPIELSRYVGKVTYVLHWIVKDKEVHGTVTKLGIEKYYKRWNHCLTTIPKILLGEETS
jgi:hypothetical protein